MKKKTTLFYLGLLFFLLGLAPSTYALEKRIATPDNPITGYGILLFDQNAETNRFVSFQMPEVSSFETIMDLGYNYYSAGACVDGIYYMTSVNSVSNAAERLFSINMETNEMALIGKFIGVPYKFADITYDYSTDKMYGIAGSSATGKSSLYIINLEDATTTKVADLNDFFFTLACSYSGQLYGVSKYGNFCKINKEDGTVEIIGSTGVQPNGNISMEFDHTDKTLYWTVNTVTDESLLCTIDVTTGKAETIGHLGSEQDAAIAGLYIPFTASSDGTPTAVTDLTITPDANGACKATLSWTNPTTVFGGGELKDLKCVDIYRNDVKVISVSPVVPGQQSSVVDIIEDSKGLLAEYKVVPVNSKGNGVETKVKVFVGEDLPAAPANISVEKIKADQAKISWEAPVNGIDKGWIDSSTLTYKIVRQPDNKTLYENLANTEFTDKVDKIGSYTYEITPSTKAGEGQKATSNVVVLGPVNELPYSCSFQTSEDVESWSIIDANNDSRVWTLANLGGSMQYNGGVIDNPPVAADDWFISHDFELEAGKEYKGTFKVKGTKSNKLNVNIGQGISVEAMTTELFNETITPLYTFTEYSYTFNVDKSGLYNIGFHLYSDGNSSFFYITDVTLEQMAATNLRMISINGPRKPVAGSTYTYHAVILNKGSQTVNSYTINLKDAVSGTILTSKTVNEPIESGSEKNIAVEWTPENQSVTNLVAEVMCDGDEISNDNTSENFSIEVLPVGSSDILDLGIVSEDKFNKNYLFNFYNKISAALNIYSPEEIGKESGLIESLIFTARNNHDYDIKDTPVKIYMANTDWNTANTQTGWIPEEDMTVVYEGPITIPQGENEITVKLSQKFELIKGKKLAVLTTHQMAEGYYNQVTFPYYNTTDNSATYYYSNDYTPFDFKNYGNAAFQQKASITIAMRCFGAEISGKVTDKEGNSIEGASLSLEGQNIIVKSNADGTYIFRYIPDGEYTIKVSKDGFHDKSVSVKVENGKNISQDFTIESLSLFNVSGHVLSATEQPLANASVILNDNNNEYSTQTAEDGSFILENVIASNNNYKLRITKDWYKPYEQDLTVNENDVETGDINMDYLIYSPSSVKSEATEENTVNVNWKTVEDKFELRKDGDKVSGNLGIDNAIQKTVIGTIYREPVRLTSVKWFVTAAGGPHSTISVYIFNLDESGEPTNEILKKAEYVTNTDDQWTSYEFDEPVNAPNGCLIALNYYGYLGIGTDSGKELSYPFSNHTYVFSGDYTGGDFDYIEDRGFNKNLMIRAEGYRLADNDDNYYGHEEANFPEFCSYKVWRYNYEEKEDTEKWTLLTNEAIKETSYSDVLDGVNSGIYCYAVRTVYPDGNMSEATHSIPFAHNMETNITVNVSSNSKSGSAEGATVYMKGIKYDETVSTTVSPDGKAIFNNIIKDKYQVTISLGGFETLSFEKDFSIENEYETEIFELQEIIVNPFNLTIENVDGNQTSALFTWNTSGTITDDFENHTDFTNGSAGEVGWIYWDLDKEETYGFQGAEFPGMGLAMSFMVFNPQSTTPDISSVEAIQPHSGSKFLASFAAANKNDDWIISPVLNYAHDFSLSFYAKSYAADGGFPDFFSVGYSETENPEVEDFKWLAENIKAESNWKEYVYTIPVSAKHIAIRNVSTSDGFILMIDDIYIGSIPNVQKSNTDNSVLKTAVPEVEYEVYLDDELVGTTSNISYLFENLEQGKHKAGVKAIYNSGNSELVSIEFGETSGIDTTDKSNSISIYPNPAKDVLYITGEYNRFAITSIDGMQIISSEVTTSPVDISNLTSGIYIVTVYDNNGNVLSHTKITVAK